LRVVADANCVGSAGVRQIVALDGCVVLVGGSERVGLPFNKGVVRRRAPNRIDEGGIVGEQFRDFVREILANADAGDVLDRVSKNGHCLTLFVGASLSSPFFLPMWRLL